MPPKLPGHDVFVNEKLEEMEGNKIHVSIRIEGSPSLFNNIIDDLWGMSISGLNWGGEVNLAPYEFEDPIAVPRTHENMGLFVELNDGTSTRILSGGDLQLSGHGTDLDPIEVSHPLDSATHRATQHDIVAMRLEFIVIPVPLPASLFLFLTGVGFLFGCKENLMAHLRQS